MTRLEAACGLLIAMSATCALALQTLEKPEASPASNPQVNSAHHKSQSPYQREDTWYEFMLKQFNPDNFDYGHWIEQQRRPFIEGQVKNPYFLYSLGTTLVLLVATAACVKLQIDHRRTMWITAEMMADLYNQDAYSRQVAEEAIERYNRHIERCNRVIESGETNPAVTATGSEIEQLRAELMRVAEERDAAIRDRDIGREDLRRKCEILAEMSVRLDAATNKAGAPGAAKVSADLRGADAKLVTHINNLQEQLYAERHNDRRLRSG